MGITGGSYESSLRPISWLGARCAARSRDVRPCSCPLALGTVAGYGAQDPRFASTCNCLSEASLLQALSRERRTVRKPRALRLRAGFIAALASAAIAAVAAPTALAGTRGQQVNVIIPWPIQALQICGHNQNNHWKCTLITASSTDPRYQQQVAWPINNWWWQGKINIRGWKTYNPSQPARTRALAHCWVPASQKNSNWTTCNEAANVDPGSIRVL
jgi:hypothetical protein